MHPFGKLHEFLAAELVVAVFVEAVKHCIGCRGTCTLSSRSAPAAWSTWSTWPTWPTSTTCTLLSSSASAGAVLIVESSTTFRSWWSRTFARILQRTHPIETTTGFLRRTLGPGRSTRTSHFAVSTTALGTIGPHFFGELHELGAAKLTVAVGIKFIEEFSWIRCSGGSTAATSLALPLGSGFAHRFAFALRFAFGFGATFWFAFALEFGILVGSIASAFTHLFAGVGAFCFAHLSIAVSVELGEDSLPHFCASVVAVLILRGIVVRGGYCGDHYRQQQTEWGD